MNEKIVTVKRGTPLTLVLTILFVIFKLTNVIGWSWWWVFSPLWIPFAFSGACFIIAVVVGIGIATYYGIRKAMK